MKDAGEGRGSRLATEGRRTCHLHSALGQKIEILYNVENECEKNSHIHNYIVSL
jgi:hypothetical protein